LENTLREEFTMDEIFKKTYVEKCVKASDELKFLRPPGQSFLRSSVLRESDFFYHESMPKYSVKKIRSIHFAAVFSEDGQEYPTYDCDWIPTRDQLIEGLKNVQFSIGKASGLNEERILKECLEKHNGKTWDEEIRVWVKIK
jgi:hypothetical protein